MKATLYLIDGPGPGRLAILPRPRGGDWLEDDVRSWRASGLDVVVSCLTTDEITELDIAREPDLCQAFGVEYIGFPVEDRGVPKSFRDTAVLVRDLESRLAQGKTVAVHCRAGVGRSALLGACLLVLAGLDPQTAFDRIAAARGCPVPDTPEQQEWVARFARELLAGAPLKE